MSTRSLLISYDAEKKIFLWAQKYQDGYANTQILNEYFPGDAGRELIKKMVYEPLEIRKYGVDLETCEFRPGSYNHGSGPIFTDLDDVKKSFAEFVEWLSHFDGPEYTSFLPGDTWLEFESDSFYPEPSRGETDTERHLRAELDELFHCLFVRARGHLESGALIPDLRPRAKRAENARYRYAYMPNFVNGLVEKYPDKVKCDLSSPDVQAEINEDFNMLFGCRDGWPEFQRCTGARLIYARTDGFICFKINPRYMANRADVVRIRRNVLDGGVAEFYKLRTIKGVTVLEEIPGRVEEWSPAAFRLKFREATALQACMPTGIFS